MKEILNESTFRVRLGERIRFVDREEISKIRGENSIRRWGGDFIAIERDFIGY